MMSRARADLIVSVLLIVFLGWIVWDARDWEIRARLFPWTIGFPMLALALIHLGLTIRKAAHIAAQERRRQEKIVDSRDAVKFLKIGGWILSFAVAMWLFGFPVGAALITLAFLLLGADERWVTALIYAVVTWVCLALIFGRLLQVEFPRPFLQTLVGV